jgi:hypothetical protein
MNQYNPQDLSLAKAAILASGPAQSMGGTLGYANKCLAPEATAIESEIAFATSRVRNELNNLGLTIEDLRRRLDPVLDLRPTPENVNECPVPSYGSELGGNIHGYANELENLVGALQRTIRQLAL